MAVDECVPKALTGIKGLAPLDHKMRDDFPESMRVRVRPINPRLFEVAHKEFQQLMCYIYKISLGPWASPLVTALKATEPFLRFCGDYTRTDEYLMMPQTVISHV